MKKTTLACAFLLIFMCLGYTSYAQTLKIKSISQVNVTVKQNSKYKLPNLVIAKMSNGSQKKVTVKWNKSYIDTTTVGTYLYSGKVSGYNKSVKIKVSIVPVITNVDEIEENVKCKQDYKLPQRVNAQFSDESEKLVPVKWETDKIDTSKAGKFEYEGIVAGLSQKVRLYLTVEPVIEKTEDIKVNILCNEEYKLPQTLSATYNDGSVKEVDVTWDKTTLNTDTPGTCTLKGTVEGYSKSVNLTVEIGETVKSVDNIECTIKHNQKYDLPSSLKAVMKDGTTKDSKVIWNQSIVDTSKVGKVDLEGQIIGYGKKVKLSLNVEATIASIDDLNVTVYRGDIYKLPTEVMAKMSDNTLKAFPVKWNNNVVDLSKLGDFVYKGKVDNYDKEVVLNLKVKSDFNLFSTTAGYSSKYVYVCINFNKALMGGINTSIIIIKDQNGAIVGVKGVQPGIDIKTTLVITPSHTLDKNNKYTIFIPKGNVKSSTGELFMEDISLDIVFVN